MVILNLGLERRMAHILTCPLVHPNVLWTFLEIWDDRWFPVFRLKKWLVWSFICILKKTCTSETIYTHSLFDSSCCQPVAIAEHTQMARMSCSNFCPSKNAVICGVTHRVRPDREHLGEYSAFRPRWRRHATIWNLQGCAGEARAWWCNFEGEKETRIRLLGWWF